MSKLDLSIDENNLNMELTRQIELFQKASMAFAQAVSVRDKCKADLDNCRARRYLFIRGEAELNGEKMTEAQLQSRIERDKKYQQALTVFLNAKQEATFAEAFKESVSQRGYMLKDLIALYIAGYYATNSVSSPEAREVKNRAYEDSKRAINQRRRSRL